MEEVLGQEWFRVENKIEEEVFHNYRVCNECGCDPIWGVLFHCLECKDYDLCESCYDIEAGKPDPHCKRHNFGFHEFPEIGYGMAVHIGYQCALCYQNPILGPMVVCERCNPYSACYCKI